jgi:hypothetical protein
VEKMKVNVNMNQNQISGKTNPNPQQNQKTNPQINQTNSQPQPTLANLSLEELYRLLRLQKSTNQNGDFIVKSAMKSSYVALRLEQILLKDKKVSVSGLGYAIPILVDSVLLVKKDMKKLGMDINIEIELFEKQTERKIISGMRAILTLS